MAAIHQPNLFPRLSTLAKLYAADAWIVLDTVQHAARDHQHRTRLANLDGTETQWLTLPVHRPDGRATAIDALTLTDQAGSRRRVHNLLAHHYASAPHWPHVRDLAGQVGDVISATGHLSTISAVSTLALLRLLGWSGEVHHASALPTRTGRSTRLADLSATIGAHTYLCGPGGSRYLDSTPFNQLGLQVQHFLTPGPEDAQAWTAARKISSLWAMATTGPDELRNLLERVRAELRSAMAPPCRSAPAMAGRLHRPDALGAVKPRRANETDPERVDARLDSPWHAPGL
ncbi:WbqC family protein [Longispora sp. NPDC051575]|uniref:WbqC family protein n=1 Tax=Longispora sp. NPDC051575 TaxID=3154943 RepID=UPI00343DBD09